MSDDEYVNDREISEVKITNPVRPRVKDPRRVAAGRKLGLMSKEMKERKARVKFKNECDEEMGKFTLSVPVITAGIAVGAAVYFLMREDPVTSQATAPIRVPRGAPETPPPTKKPDPPARKPDPPSSRVPDSF